MNQHPLPDDFELPGLRTGNMLSKRGRVFTSADLSPEEREWLVLKTEELRLQIEDKKTVRYFQDFWPRFTLFLLGALVGVAITSGLWMYADIKLSSFTKGATTCAGLFLFIFICKRAWPRFRRFSAHRIRMIFRKDPPS